MDLNRSRELLSQAVEHLEHVAHDNSGQQSINVNTNSQPNASSGRFQPNMATANSRSVNVNTQSNISGSIQAGTTNRLSGSSFSSHFISPTMALLRPAQCCNTSKPSKKKKLAVWRHSFVCLASPSDDMVPSNIDKAILIRIGLGLKELTFFCIGILLIFMKILSRNIQN